MRLMVSAISLFSADPVELLKKLVEIIIHVYKRALFQTLCWSKGSTNLVIFKPGVEELH